MFPFFSSPVLLIVLRPQVSYGIGTFFTNDFHTASSGGAEKSKALNIVIKLSSADDRPAVKISDDMTKVRDNFSHP